MPASPPVSLGRPRSRPGTRASAMLTTAKAQRTHARTDTAWAYFEMQENDEDDGIAPTPTAH